MTSTTDPKLRKAFIDADAAALRNQETDWSSPVPTALGTYSGAVSRADVGDRRLCHWVLATPDALLVVTLDCPPGDEAARTADTEAILLSLRGGIYARATSPFVKRARRFFKAKSKDAHVSDDGRTVRFESGRTLPLHDAFTVYATTRWPLRWWRTDQSLARLHRAEMEAASLDALARDFEAIKDRLRVRLYRADGVDSENVLREDFEGIESALVLDTSLAYFPVSRTASANWSVTLDQAYALALRNVATRTSVTLYQMQGPNVAGFYRLAESEGFAAVRVLLPEVHPEWFGSRGSLFILAEQDQVFFLPLTHEVGVEKMHQFAGLLRHLQETDCCPLSAHLYWVHGHRIVTLPWSPYGDDEATLLPSPGLQQILG